MSSTIITLAENNVVPYLVKYVELSQSKGAFNIAEGDLLKRAIDVSCRGSSDHEINENHAISLLIQAVHKGQLHGDYTLNDASLLHNVIKFIGDNNITLHTKVSQDGVPAVEDSGNVTTTTAIPPTPPTPAPSPSQLTEDDEDDFDLSELSAPVPLRPREI